jgi:DNA modification methylase
LAPGKGRKKAPIPSTIFYFGPNAQGFCELFSKFGQVVKLNPKPALDDDEKPDPKPKPKPKPELVRCDFRAGEPFFRILQCDVRELLADLPVVHCVICSPPYFNLITYGDSDRRIGHELTVEAFIATLVAIFVAIPLHPLGSIWVNIADSRRDGHLLNVPGRFIAAMQAAGFRLVDDVVWAKVVATRDGTTGRVLPEPCADRLNANGYEPFFRFVKDKNPWTDTCAVQVARNNVPPQLYLPEDLMRTRGCLNGRNLPNVWLVSGRPSRRWSSEHYGCFPVELVERPIAMTCPPFVNPDGTLPRRIVEQVEYDDGIGVRTFGKSQPAAGISGRHDVGVTYTPRRPLHLGWEPVSPDATPGVVFDPFTGTATTGEVSLKMGRSFIGCELYKQHVETAARRCAEAMDYVRHHYGYAAVCDRILNPPAPNQDDGDDKIIRLDEMVNVVVLRNDPWMQRLVPVQTEVMLKRLRRSGTDR